MPQQKATGGKLGIRSVFGCAIARGLKRPFSAGQMQRLRAQRANMDARQHADSSASRIGFTQVALTDAALLHYHSIAQAGPRLWRSSPVFGVPAPVPLSLPGCGRVVRNTRPG